MHTLLVQLNQEHAFVLLRLGDVRRNIRILRRLKVGAPPVADGVLDDPVLLDAVLSAERLCAKSSIALLCALLGANCVFCKT